MATHRIAVIPGDGIGQEVIPEGLKVLRTVQEIVPGLHLEYEEFPWGTDYYLQHGVMMPENALQILATFDAIYFGAVGDPQRVPDHITLNGLILPIRKHFQQYACVRPVQLLPGAPCPLVGKTPADIDFVVVRENTEGEYADAGGWIHRGAPQEVAIQTAIFTRAGCERIMRFAFELARKRNKKRRVTSITKSNAQKYGMVFWDSIFREVAARYPDVEANAYLVDAAAMNFIRCPEVFDVVVASNLFADILTDLGAVIMGGMGFAPSANLNPERTYPSMFEAVHGSAPDIKGQGIANPIATIWAGQMMLDFLGEAEAAARILRALATHVQRGTVRTPDLGGHHRTSDVGDSICAILREQAAI
ncbi:MAG: tartrate dehydrogenase [Candidatus Tectimicrobiota bacterium]|nr:MAG: tartrate dehydrogenase [Candidatus Tectomicrobia bacterium]